MTDENMMVRHHYARAQEVLRDLSKDGYPSDAQWTILCMAICEVARDARDWEHLSEGVKITRDAVVGGSEVAFERRAAQR